MDSLFTRALLGHLMGDYLLQGRTMAIAKSQLGWKGIGWCTSHAAIYTAACCLWLWTLNSVVIAGLFTSHWVIDRWSLARWWLNFIGGREIRRAYYATERFHEIDLIFSCLVYAVVDNTFHLMVLWVIVRAIVLHLT